MLGATHTALLHREIGPPNYNNIQILKSGCFEEIAKNFEKNRLDKRILQLAHTLLFFDRNGPYLATLSGIQIWPNITRDLTVEFWDLYRCTKLWTSTIQRGCQFQMKSSLFITEDQKHVVLPLQPPEKSLLILSKSKSVEKQIPGIRPYTTQCIANHIALFTVKTFLVLDTEGNEIWRKSIPCDVDDDQPLITSSKKYYIANLEPEAFCTTLFIANLDNRSVCTHTFLGNVKFSAISTSEDSLYAATYTTDPDGSYVNAKIHVMDLNSKQTLYIFDQSFQNGIITTLTTNSHFISFILSGRKNNDQYDPWQWTIAKSGSVTSLQTMDVPLDLHDLVSNKLTHLKLTDHFHAFDQSLNRSLSPNDVFNTYLDGIRIEKDRVNPFMEDIFFVYT